MQDNSKNFIILGPLSLEIEVKGSSSIQLKNEISYSKNSRLFYGGTLLKILKFLRALNCENSLLCSYLGQDEIGKRIQENIEKEKFESIIQIMPNQTTPVSILMHHKTNYSYLIDENKNLSLWLLRIKQMKIKGGNIFYLDPSIPGKMQNEIIKSFKDCKFIVRKPIDNDFCLFEENEGLIILMNEFEGYKIASESKFIEYSIKNLFFSHLLKNHFVLIETKTDLNIFDKESQSLKFINIYKHKKIHSFLNEAFISGLLLGISSNISIDIAFIWGLVAVLNRYHENFSKTQIINEVAKFKWTLY